MKKNILFVMIFALMIASMLASADISGAADVSTTTYEPAQSTTTSEPYVTTTTEPTTTTTLIEQPYIQCRDSDHGLKFYLKGDADNRDGNGIGSYYADTCLAIVQDTPNSSHYQEVTQCSGSACVLQEAYCNGAEVTNIAHYCANGCVQGRCYYPGYFMSTDKKEYSDSEVILLDITSAKDDRSVVDFYIQPMDAEPIMLMKQLTVDKALRTKIVISEHKEIFTKSGSYSLLLVDAGAEPTGTGDNTNSIPIQVNIGSYIEVKYAKLGEKFFLVESQSVKITNYYDMKITLQNWMCTGACVPEQSCYVSCAVALDVEMPNSCEYVQQTGTTSSIAGSSTSTSSASSNTSQSSTGYTSCAIQGAHIVLSPENPTAHFAEVNITLLGKEGEKAYLIVEKIGQTPIQPPGFPDEEGNITIDLAKGWNLVSAPGKIEDIDQEASNQKLLAYVYIKEEKRYLSFQDAEKYMSQEKLKDYLSKNAFWIYAPEKTRISMTLESKTQVEDISLVKGWNFVPVTKDMVGYHLGAVQGNCAFEKMYLWNEAEQKWVAIGSNYYISESLLGHGMLISSAKAGYLGLFMPTPVPVVTTTTLAWEQ